MTNASVIAPVAQVKWLKNSAISIWKHWNTHIQRGKERQSRSAHTSAFPSFFFFSLRDIFFFFVLRISVGTHTYQRMAWTSEERTNEWAGATSGQWAGVNERERERESKAPEETPTKPTTTPWRSTCTHTSMHGAACIYVLWMFLWLFDCCCCCLHYYSASVLCEFRTHKPKMYH